MLIQKTTLWVILVVLIFAVPTPARAQLALIIDHDCADIVQIPNE